MSSTLERTESNVITPRSTFILRFISTIALWTIALLIMFSGYEILFWVLISLFGLIGLLEFYLMLDHKGLPNFKFTGMICGAVLLAGSFYYFSKIGPAHSYDFEVAVMGAYLTGSVVGRHLMVPHISGKKTWEGFFGAIVFALLCSLGLFKLMPGHLSALNWTHTTILGVLLGLGAVLGDLAESIIKRSTDVKDSGNLLPGIGGALDLLDSLLFTAPLLFFYMRLVIRVA